MAFRHVLRNIYGYELEAERIAQLVSEYEAIWSQFEVDVRKFVVWLKSAAEQLDQM